MKIQLISGSAKRAIFYLLLLSCLANPALNAQKFIYAKALNNSGAIAGQRLPDQGKSIAVDPLGNTFITGSFVGTVDFDPGPGVANLAATRSGGMFIASYDPSGNYIYAKAIGGTRDVYAYGLAIDGSGNSYVTGLFSETVDFDPGPGDASLTSAGNWDIFIAKYDASGNYVFAKAIGSGGDDVGKSIVVDGTGNIYITGGFSGTVDFDPASGTANLTSNAGSTDIFIARYDASGNYVYAKAIGGANAETTNGIALDGAGNVYITGYFSGTVDVDPGAGEATLVSNAGTNDIFFARYDGSGNYTYAKAIGGGANDGGNGIAVDGSGNVYVTGFFTGMVDFDPGPGEASRSAESSFDAFTARYDVSGNYVYAKTIGGISEEYGNSIAVDRAGYAHVTGFFKNTVYFDGISGPANLTSASGSFDIFVARYDASGNYLSAKAMGGVIDDRGESIAVDGSGNEYITGYFGATADFDRGGSSNSVIMASSDIDIFIAKYAPSGSLPIELQSFTATAIRNGATVQLNWSTASEQNNAWFEVERSKDGIRFESIGRRPGCSSCSILQKYQLDDNSPYAGLSYYRLKQVDVDNAFSYGPVVLFNNTKTMNEAVRVYPAVTKGDYEVRIQNERLKKQVIIQVLNAAGNLVQQQTVWLYEGNNRFNNSLANQPKGVYYIRVAGENYTVPVAMIIKE